MRIMILTILLASFQCYATEDVTVESVSIEDELFIDLVDSELLEDASLDIPEIKDISESFTELSESN